MTAPTAELTSPFQTPLEYVLEVYDTLIVPTLTAETEVKRAVRVHVYRRLLVDAAKGKFAALPQVLPTDLILVTLASLESIGLL